MTPNTTWSHGNARCPCGSEALFAMRNLDRPDELRFVCFWCGTGLGHTDHATVAVLFKYLEMADEYETWRLARPEAN